MEYQGENPIDIHEDGNRSKQEPHDEFPERDFDTTEAPFPPE